MNLHEQSFYQIRVGDIDWLFFITKRPHGSTWFLSRDQNMQKVKESNLSSVEQ